MTYDPLRIGFIGGGMALKRKTSIGTGERCFPNTKII